MGRLGGWGGWGGWVAVLMGWVTGSVGGWVGGWEASRRRGGRDGGSTTRSCFPVPALILCLSGWAAGCLQTEEARAEAAHLMGVMSNLCTPKSGEILIAATQARIGSASAGSASALCCQLLQLLLLLLLLVPCGLVCALPGCCVWPTCPPCPTCRARPPPPLRCLQHFLPPANPPLLSFFPPAPGVPAGLPDLCLPADQQGSLPQPPTDLPARGLHDRWAAAGAGAGQGSAQDSSTVRRSIVTTSRCLPAHPPSHLSLAAHSHHLARLPAPPGT